ncbi:MAG: sortase, partial [Clostridia bacterium]|nr:sortase [Clostridia bacterium]
PARMHLDSGIRLRPPATDEPQAPTPSPAPTLAAAASTVPALTRAPAPTLPPRLTARPYPGNAGLKIGSRFQALRKENKDIVGFLSIPRLLEEAVVQRDNVFYLTHDAYGRENANGAIFLDAGVGLKTRPYTLLLYGHNMRSGAMFGCLRNYENTAFYRQNPWIAFDSLYEEGKYVIFSVGRFSMEAQDQDYLDLYALLSVRLEERQAAIARLTEGSMYTQAADVAPEDQLLLLVTCMDDPADRRVVAARRLRPGEDETALAQQVSAVAKR